MGISLIDLDIDRPLPAWIDLARDRRLWLFVWQGTEPLLKLEIHSDSGVIPGAEISRRIREALACTADSPSLRRKSVEFLPSVSVVVRTCGRPMQLFQCLESLRHQSVPPREVMIVDADPLHGPIREIMLARFPDFLYSPVSKKERRHARNLGVDATTGEVVAFIDGDCRPTEGWISALAHNFVATPRLGCCTGQVWPTHLRSRTQERREAGGAFTLGFRRWEFTCPPLSEEGDLPLLQTWRCGTGANMAFRRSALCEVNGFETSPGIADDLDIFFRILMQGFDLVYDPRSVVRHHLPCEGRELRRHLFLWSRGYVGYLLKVAQSNPLYRQPALREVKRWLSSRVLQSQREELLQSRLPLHLALAKLSGGICALPQRLFFPAPLPRPAGQSGAGGI